MQFILGFPCGEAVERSETDGGCEAQMHCLHTHIRHASRATFSQEKARILRSYLL